MSVTASLAAGATTTAAFTLPPNATNISEETAEKIRRLVDGAPVEIALLAVFEIIILVTTILFIVMARKPSIRMLSVSLTVAQSVFIFIGTPLLVLQIPYFGQWPCVFTFLGTYLGIVCWTLCVLARLFRLRRIYFFHQRAVLKYDTHKHRVPTVSMQSLVRNVSPTPVLRNKSSRGGFSSHGDEEYPGFQYPPPLEGSAVQQFLPSESSLSRTWRGLSIEAEATVRVWIGLGSIITVVALYLIAIISFSDSVRIGDDLFKIQDPTTVIGIPGKTTRGLACRIEEWVFWPALGYMGLFLVAIIPVSLFMMRKTNDLHGVRVDVGLTLIAALPSFVLYFVDALFLWQFSTPYLGPNYFVYPVFAISHFVSVILPLIRTTRRRRQMGDLTLNMDSFRTVLKEQDMFVSLKKAAVRDFCSEQTIFLEETDILHEHVINLLTSPPMPIPPPPVSRLGLSAKPSLQSLRTIVSNTAHLSGNSTSNYLSPPVNGGSFSRFPSDGFGTTESVSPADHVPAWLMQEPMTPPRNSTSSNIVPTNLVPQYRAVLDVFIRPGAPMELNLSALVRADCVDAVESGIFDVDVFNAAREQVIQSLFLNTFPKLLHDKARRRSRTSRDGWQ
ncbi:hypothetical protein BJ742DRAFT_801021 [Cladochytrium replicatum]|nr:hypothetical protein BJ742DRAFT_801021 [Cladochytrium replicatum]